jgi:hypothetical protein
LQGVLSYSNKPLARSAILAAFLAPIVFLTKYYDRQWIEAQRENQQVMESIVHEIAELPQHSRVYVEDVPWTKNQIPRIDYSLPAAIGLYFDRTNVQGALHFLPANKALALEREDYKDNLPWQYFRLRKNSEGMYESERLDFFASVEPHSYGWDFGKRADAQLLSPAVGMIASMGQRFAWPFFQIGEPWTFLWLPRMRPHQPMKYVTLDLMITGKSKGTDICRLFWITEDDQEISGGKSIGFFVKTDGEFHTYRIPVYRNGLTLIHPNIVRFALRPSQQIGTYFSIKSCRVEYY